MTLKRSNYNVLYWWKFLQTYKKSGFMGDKIIINNKIYILLFLLFKNLTLKNLCSNHYNSLLNLYDYGIYKNILEFRFYFVFYYIVIKNHSIKFLWFIHIQMIDKQDSYCLQYKYNYHHYIIQIFIFIYYWIKNVI